MTDWRAVIVQALVYGLLMALGGGAAVSHLGGETTAVRAETTAARQDVRENHRGERARLERIEVMLSAHMRDCGDLGGEE